MVLANLQACAPARRDEQAHVDEHSLEVQLPFCKRAAGRFHAALALATLDVRVLQGVGEAVAQAVKNTGRAALVLASSDMNHFEDLAATRRLDALAMERLEAFDPAGLIAVVVKERISMCGAGPAAAMLWAAKALGAASVQRIAYATSADAWGRPTGWWDTRGTSYFRK